MTDRPHERLKPVPPEDWSDAQRAAAQDIIDGPRGALYGPFVPLLRSPELMGHAQRVGEYLRYRSAIGVRLSELAILVTAREWDQQVEWAIHAPIAQQVGIPADVIAAIARRERPPALLVDETVVYDFCMELQRTRRVSDRVYADALALLVDETVVYDFCMELQRTRRVSDRVYADALALFGEQGVVDLMGVNGYYTFLAMVMNTAQTAAPPSSAAPLPD